MSRSWTVFLLSAATIVTVLLRLPFVAQQPTEWDVANYLLALDQLDLQQHRPHAPGYPVYVMAGRLMAALVGDPHRGLVYLSALLSALALPATWLLARQFLPISGAWWVALAATFNPLTWFYASVGLSGISELTFAPLILWLCVRALRGDALAFVVAGLMLGFAGGWRPNLLFFLSPPWALTLWRAPIGVRARVQGAVVLPAAVLAWLVPLIWSAGGWQRFLEASSYVSTVAREESFLRSGSLQALTGNLLRFASAATMAIAPAGLIGLLLLPRLRNRPRPPQLWFLFAAIAVPTAFFVLAYFHKKAYALVLLAPVLVVSVCALGTLRPLLRRTLLAASLLIANVAYFALPADESVFAREGGRLEPSAKLTSGPRLLRHWLMPTLATLRERDRRIAATDAVITGLLAENASLVLVVPGTQAYDARTLMVHWPQVDVWILSDEADAKDVGFARGGHLESRPPAAFRAAITGAPSLWLTECVTEFAEPTVEPSARIFAGPDYRLVLLPPG